MIDREYYQNRIFHCILKIYPRSCGPDHKECYEAIVDFLFAGSQTAKTTQQTEGGFPPNQASPVGLYSQMF